MSVGTSATALGAADLVARLAGQNASPRDLAASKPDWLKTLRGEAVERLGALRLPTTHDEAWRFTGIAALAEQSFNPPIAAPAPLPSEIEPFRLEEAAIRLVFIDGVHAPELSSLPDDGPTGLVVGTLATLAPGHASILQSHLGRHAEFRHHLFAALNTAFLHDAAVVLVPREASVAAPVHLLYVATQPGVVCHPRILVVSEPGSHVTVIEDYVALHEGGYFTNAVAEFSVGPDATIDHVRVQRESGNAFHVGNCAVALDRQSRYRSVSVALGARLSRLDVDVLQNAPGGECHLDGLAVIGDRQVADTHSRIDHLKPHGISRQLHKCIVDGSAHAVFNGKVLVRPGAQKTDSAQSSRNLLLSPKAVVDTLPQLEIFADDVKCTHGATVGQLDADEVFYLRSRGLSQEAARNLLTYAFGAEVIDRIPVPSLRRQLERTVLARTVRQP